MQFQSGHLSSTSFVAATGVWSRGNYPTWQSWPFQSHPASYNPTINGLSALGTPSWLNASGINKSTHYHLNAVASSFEGSLLGIAFQRLGLERCSCRDWAGLSFWRRRLKCRSSLLARICYRVLRISGCFLRRSCRLAASFRWSLSCPIVNQSTLETWSIESELQNLHCRSCCWKCL